MENNFTMDKAELLNTIKLEKEIAIENSIENKNHYQKLLKIHIGSISVIGLCCAYVALNTLSGKLNCFDALCLGSCALNLYANYRLSSYTKNAYNMYNYYKIKSDFCDESIEQIEKGQIL